MVLHPDKDNQIEEKPRAAAATLRTANKSTTCLATHRQPVLGSATQGLDQPWEYASGMAASGVSTRNVKLSCR